MLRSMKEIIGYEFVAQDGSIGRCHDFLFDDRDWVVRYLVADTGKWLPSRKVLISPIALENPDWERRRLEAALTKQQVENAPSLSEDEPVSKQYELDYFAHYGWPHYWVGPGPWGPYPLPKDLRKRHPDEKEMIEERLPGDPHLRSSREVKGYHVAAADRDIGHIEDLIIEDDAWVIRYSVVDTRNWLPGRKVLVAPGWLTSIDWPQRKVHTDLTAEEIENSPEYDPSMPIKREYEEQLHDSYRRPVYWGGNR